MPQSLSNLIMHLKPYWLDSASAVAGIEINKIIYFPVAGPAQFLSKTAANLTAALALMAAGDAVQINGPCTLTGNFTIPAGGMLRALSRYEVTIIGTVTANDASSIYNFTIAATANDANALYGVIGPVTGSAYLLACDITATQAGAGNAYAIGATRGATTNNGNIYADDCYLYGSSVGGSGYAARSTRGKIYITGNTRGAYGSTDRYVTV